MNAPNARAFAVLASYAQAISTEARFTDRSVTVTNAAGDFTNRIAKGGIYNATCHVRASHGVTKDDIAKVRRELKTAGETVTLDQAEAMLMSAVRGELKIGDRTAAERMRRRRAKARALRLCIVNPKHGNPGEGRTTCQTCQDEARARQERLHPITVTEDYEQFAEVPF